MTFLSLHPHPRIRSGRTILDIRIRRAQCCRSLEQSLVVLCRECESMRRTSWREPRLDTARCPGALSHHFRQSAHADCVLHYLPESQGPAAKFESVMVRRMAKRKD